MSAYSAAVASPSATLNRLSKYVIASTAPAPTGPFALPTVEAFWDDQVNNGGAGLGFTDRTSASVGFWFSEIARVYVIPFRLPYLAPGQTITSVTLQWDYLGKNGSPAHNVDVYGMARRSTASNPVPIAADYFCGANDASNTLLLQPLITPATVAGTLTLSNAALLAFVQGQYAAFAAGGTPDTADRTIFFRLSTDATEGPSGFNINYKVANSYTLTGRGNLPTMKIVTTGAVPIDAGTLVFYFTLPSAKLTSAGVFNTVTGALLRTLWSNLPCASGSNYSAWDGNDDFGTAIAAGTYQIRVIHHNFNATWDGVIGNTSTNSIGRNVFRSLYPPVGLAIDPAGGGNAFFAPNYNEFGPNFGSFALAAPQVCNWLTPYSNPDQGNTNAVYGLVATDGITIYWAQGAGGITPGATFVLGMNMAGTSFNTFASGGAVPASPGTPFVTSAIDVDTTGGQPNPASGLAVQQSGSLIFVSHSNLGIVRVFNKTTGAATTVPSTTLVTPSAMAWCEATSNLYVISNAGTLILKCTVNASTGLITLASTLVTGLQNALSISVDPTGAVITVIDGGSSQQIKSFSATTGLSTWTYGTAGGNAVNGPSISNNLFMFGVQTNATTDIRTGIAYAPDGTFWVLDNGNFRMMHFSVSGTTVTFIERIAFNNVSYICNVDLNDPTRLFNQFLEYHLDYTKTLDNGVNGSWTLVKNWFAGLSNTDYNLSPSGISSPATLSNGRTYAIIHNGTTNTDRVVELTSTGLRDTGVNWSTPSTTSRIHADGSLRTCTAASSGVAYTPTTKPLTGFDGSGNPIWGSATNLYTYTPGTNDPLAFQQNRYPSLNVSATSNNIFPVWDNGKTSTGYHIGLIKAGASALLSRTGLTTPQGSAYVGKFPLTAKYDIGNGVNFPASIYLVWGNYIIFGYHGENWGGASGNDETNEYYVYRDDGLLVGTFGALGGLIGSNHIVTGAGFAGNASSPAITTNPVTGLPTLYNNDESNHSATLRWTLNGLNAVTTLAGTGTIGQVIGLV